MFKAQLGFFTFNEDITRAIDISEVFELQVFPSGAKCVRRCNFEFFLVTRALINII